MKWTNDTTDFSIRDEHGELIAHYARRPDGSHVGNARMIASAPELLKELEMAADMLASCASILRRCTELPLSADVVEDREIMARAAISAATDETIPG